MMMMIKEDLKIFSTYIQYISKIIGIRNKKYFFVTFGRFLFVFELKSYYFLIL